MLFSFHLSFCRPALITSEELEDKKKNKEKKTYISRTHVVGVHVYTSVKRFRISRSDNRIMIFFRPGDDVYKLTGKFALRIKLAVNYTKVIPKHDLKN